LLPERKNYLYPTSALNYFGTFARIVFLIGILAAAFSSADSALTTLTTSFCVDILDISKQKTKQEKTRFLVHIGFSLLMFVVIIIFDSLNNPRGKPTRH